MFFAEFEDVVVLLARFSILEAFLAAAALSARERLDDASDDAALVLGLLSRRACDGLGDEELAVEKVHGLVDEPEGARGRGGGVGVGRSVGWRGPGLLVDAAAVVGRRLHHR